MSSNVPFIFSSAVGALLVALTPSVLADPSTDPATCADVGAADAALSPPSSATLAFAMHAEGVQIYACSSPAGGPPAWTLQAPEATLLDEHALPVGTHGAGPAWTAADGSTVRATKVAASQRGHGAVPWLLLRATSHDGRGRMSDVAFVQRVETSGGVAPAEGCGEKTVGTLVRVPYRALYCFYRGERP